MKKIYIVILILCFYGCMAKKWKLKKDFSRNAELIRSYSLSIKNSDELYAQYSSDGDSFKALKYLNQLVKFIKQRDSVIKINDSLFKELKKYPR